MQNQEGEKTQSAKVEKYDWRVVVNNNKQLRLLSKKQKNQNDILGRWL